jgi:hypothetical protein
MEGLDPAIRCGTGLARMAETAQAMTVRVIGIASTSLFTAAGVMARSRKHAGSGRGGRLRLMDLAAS